eukprot:gene11218-biopygen19863
MRLARTRCFSCSPLLRCIVRVRARPAPAVVPPFWKCLWAGRAQGGGGGVSCFCHPGPRARSPGAQMLRMGSGSSPAFQRLSRDSISAVLSARKVQHHIRLNAFCGAKKRRFSGRGFRTTSGAFLAVPRSFCFRTAIRTAARAPGAQMIRMESGSRLTFQSLSREPLSTVLSVRFAEMMSAALLLTELWQRAGRPGPLPQPPLNSKRRTSPHRR